MFEVLDFILEPIKGEFVSAIGFWAIAPIILSGMNTAYGIYKSESQEEPEESMIPPPLGLPRQEAPPIDLMGMAPSHLQPTDYSMGALSQAMQSFGLPRRRY
jgi:hypothetical protein